MLGALGMLRIISAIGIGGALVEIRTTDTYKRYKNSYNRLVVIKQIKNIFTEIFKAKNISYVADKREASYPKIKSINFIEYGFKVDIDISLVCSIKDIEGIQDYIRATFKAYEVKIEEIEGIISISIYKEPLKDKPYKKVALSPYKLLLGHSYKGNIIADMRINPYLLICGLGGSGKTQMAKTIINNLENADIVILNAYKDDFKAYEGLFINGDKNILEYLNSCLEMNIERCRPMYLLIDELIVLCRNKEISKAITDLLAVARHSNIYIIGISQIGTKEQLKFKDLFNSRVCMKFIENSAYQTVLGCGVDGALKQREFYLYSDGLYRGKTFINSI